MTGFNYKFDSYRTEFKLRTINHRRAKALTERHNYSLLRDNYLTVCYSHTSSKHHCWRLQADDVLAVFVAAVILNDDHRPPLLLSLQRAVIRRLIIHGAVFYTLHSPIITISRDGATRLYITA